MRCASCGATPAPAARFCDRCGAALVRLDPTSAVPPGATAEPSPDGADRSADVGGDRRIVTALFADLVDYVRMLAEHDPEVVRARVTGALDTMAGAIARFGGTREKFIGDAVFAVFGWPRAHDDDAVRAALAGLEIRTRLGELVAGHEPMEVRVGIATGEVVAVGAPGGAGHGDMSLTGEAITTAARIQSLARSGEILLDGPTVRAARERLAVEARGSVVLRGQSTPVQLFALLGEAGMGAWSPHRTRMAGPLIGREEEIGRLRGLLDRLHETGRGGIAVVVGDAGVGKTRLLAAMEAEARERGLAWTWTENVSYGRGEPYRFARLFAQTIADEHGIDSGSLARSYLFTDDLSAADVQRFGGAIAAIAREAAFTGWEAEAAHMPSDPAEIAATLAEVASRYLGRLMASDGPRVVVVDDLHWVDPSSVGMVDLLVETAARGPLVLLAGIRPGALPAWMDRPGVERIDLRGLREPETAQLATHIARAALDADGARSIHERTGGNPLFVAETVRASLEDGTLAWRDGRVVLVESGSRQMPVTLRAVLGARIDALDPEARDVLGVASVIGIRFDTESIGDLLGGVPPGDAILGRLAEAALVVPVESGGWRFAHPLIHDAAYAGLLGARRRALHARMADRLESGRRPVPLGNVAAHRVAAGDTERALPLLRDAAASAMALGAAAEAAEFWHQAADLAEADDPTAAAHDRALAAEAVQAARALRDAAFDRAEAASGDA